MYTGTLKRKRICFFFQLQKGACVSEFLKNLNVLFCRFARVGSVVLALHDGSDVFMEIAKMSKYSGFQMIADIFFSLFAMAFTFLRIICYPFWVIRSTW